MWPDHGAPDESDFKTIYFLVDRLREARAIGD